MINSTQMASPYKLGIGIMSGTSLDGIDIALCEFGESHSFQILEFETLAYPRDWTQKLRDAPSLDAQAYFLLENEYTQYNASLVNDFISRKGRHPDYIAIHGHTIFHRPEAGLTRQMINGSLLSALTRCVVVCDFRSGDVGRGGQGAPLVPIGDELLFGGYDACLNLGGFANISYREQGQRKAFDICPVNIVLNWLSEFRSLAFDPGGENAAKGEVIPDLLKQLNSNAFYSLEPPKSLGREWVEKEILPLLFPLSERWKDLLRTYTEHAATQIAKAFSICAMGRPSLQVLVTGGGAYNLFLMERIKVISEGLAQIHLPDATTIDAKEALIFAFLGRLRLLGIENCLASVTGASVNSISGAVYMS